MNRIIRTLLIITNIISWVIMAITTIIVVLGELVGYDKTTELLERIHIPISFNTLALIALVCTPIGIITASLLWTGKKTRRNS